MNKILPQSHRGFSLIEVLIAVLVLSIGLLALAALQGELFRAGAEAKARANATTIAQQVIEDARSFAFISAPDVSYTDATYEGLGSGAWSVTGVSGVDFGVSRVVERYRWSEGDGRFVVSAEPYSGGVPEFKLVRVEVSWTGGDGGGKSITLTDTIAAIAPSDVAQVMQEPTAASQGPQVWIEPPNKDNPRVVPIAIGDGKSAASSNPTPEQYIEDVSAVTRFSVLSFSGAGEEVLVNRRLEVAAASCVCQEAGTSTSLNPAYKPTEWNGIQLAYMEPQTVSSGAPIGTAVVSNVDSEIEPICTICCRDHHVYADRTPVVDPYRASVNGDSTADHYGYASRGTAYDIAGGLLPTSKTGGTYLDACQLVRVGGRMRLAVDAQQVSLVAAALTDDGKTYRITDFIDQYSVYVTKLLQTSLGVDAKLPAGYPSPTAKFPGPTPALEAEFAGIIEPSAIPLSTEGEQKSLVAFGLYVDYLNEDTLLAYRCAATGDNTGACLGLGNRNALEALPFYAVNVASLADWSSEAPMVASVATATYDNKGSLATNGGVVTAGRGSSSVDANGNLIPVDVTLTINNSNSGLTSTSAVDLHDGEPSSYISDSYGFTKKDGAVVDSVSNWLYVSISTTAKLQVSTVGVTLGGKQCNYSSQYKRFECAFQSPFAASDLVVSNYVGVKQVGNNPPTMDENRQVCFPTSDVRISKATVVNSATINETSYVRISGLTAQDYSMSVSIWLESDPCPQAGLSLTP